MKIVNIHCTMSDIPANKRGISTIRGLHLTEQDHPVRIKELLNIVGVEELERRNKTVIYQSEISGTKFFEDLPPAFAKEYASHVENIKARQKEIDDTNVILSQLREHADYVSRGLESPHKDLFQSLIKEPPSNE